MSRTPVIPPGSWPRRMPANLAAGYCGESTVEGFLKRVGKDYPNPPNTLYTSMRILNFLRLFTAIEINKIEAGSERKRSSAPSPRSSTKTGSATSKNMDLRSGH